MSSAVTTTSKPSLWATWRVGDAGVCRGNAEQRTSKSGHPCPCQNRSQGLPAEKSGRGSSLNRLSCPPDDPIGQSAELNGTDPSDSQGHVTYEQSSSSSMASFGRPLQWPSRKSLSSSAPQRSPYSFSLRGLFSDHVSPVDQRAVDGAGESVLLSLGQYHTDTFLIGRFSVLWKRWVFSLLCPVHNLKRMICSDHKSDSYYCLTRSEYMKSGEDFSL